jgi:putative ABC transport system permease protein
LLLVSILAVSMGLTLIMITVDNAFAQRLDDIKREVGSDITIRPAGSFGGGFFGGVAIRGPGAGTTEEPSTDITTPDPGFTALEEDTLDAIADVDHVASASKRVSGAYQGDELVSAIEPPPGFTQSGGNAGFSPPVFLSGTDDPNSLATVGPGDATLSTGRTFQSGEEEANVAVLGAALAEKNGLDVGDTFEMNGETFEIIGIFDTGTQFGDNSIVLPLKTAQAVLDREGEVDEVIVRADSVDNVEQVAADLRTTLGEDTVDVSTQQSAFSNISAPVSDARDSSRIGLFAALIASAAVILVAVGLVARQRIKEIGILKAVGASGWHVTAQFGVETAIIAAVAAFAGALATFPLAQSVANGLVSDPSLPGPRFEGPGGGPPGGGGFVEVVGGPAAEAGGLLGNVDVAVSPEVFLYALGLAVGLAIIAAIVPAWYVSRVRPAEVLRYE